MNPPPSEFPTWRDFERIERDLKDLASECRAQRTMSREDIVDRLTLIAERFKDSLAAVQLESNDRMRRNEKGIESLRSLIERVIFAVIGALATAVLSLILEFIKLLGPKATGGG